MGHVQGKPSSSERPDWSQRMLVLPSLLAIDTRLWIAPERRTWSLTSGAWDGLTDELLALRVGPEMPWRSRTLIESAHRLALTHHYEELLNTNPFE